MESMVKFLFQRQLGMRNLGKFYVVVEEKLNGGKQVWCKSKGAQPTSGLPVDAKKCIVSLDCMEQDVALVAENEGNPFEQVPIYDIKFCPIQFHPDLVGVTDELGFVSIVNTKPGIDEADKVVLKEQCHQNALVGMDWSPFVDGTLATCSGDKTVKVWDLKADFGNVATLTGHERSVKSVRFHPANPDYLASCSRDGSIRLWDCRKENGETNVIRQSHGGSNGKLKQCQVTDVVFYDENTIISCGATDSVIKMWDIRKTYSCRKKIYPLLTIESQCEDSACVVQGYNSLHLDCMNNLYASAFHKVLKFSIPANESGRSQPAQYVAPDVLGPYVKINTSRDGRFLISGSSAAEVYIWDTCDEICEPFAVLKSHTMNENVSSCVADFCPSDAFKIVCATDEGRIQIWRPRVTDGKKKPAVSAAALGEKHVEIIQSHKERCQMGSHSIRNREEAFTMKLRCRSQFKGVTAPSISSTVHYEPHTHEPAIMKKMMSNLPNFVMDGTHPSFHYTLARGRKQSTKKLCWLGKIKLLPRNTSNIQPEKRILETSPERNPKTPDVQKSNKRLRLSEKDQIMLSPSSPASAPRSRKSSVSRLKTGGMRGTRSRSTTPVPNTTPTRNTTPARARKSIKTESCSSPKILQFCISLDRPGEKPASPRT